MDYEKMSFDEWKTHNCAPAGRSEYGIISEKLDRIIELLEGILNK